MARYVSDVFFLAMALLSVAVAQPALADDGSHRPLAYWSFVGESLEPTLGDGRLKHDFNDTTFYSGTDVNALPEAHDDDPPDASPSLALVGGAGVNANGTGGNNGASLYFLVHTADHEGLRISLAARRSSTGFVAARLAYSTDDGRSFTNLDAEFEPTDDFTAHTLDLSDVSELDDRANLVIRITFAGATHARGNNRLDNILFSARPMQ